AWRGWRLYHQHLGTDDVCRPGRPRPGWPHRVPVNASRGPLDDGGTTMTIPAYRFPEYIERGSDFGPAFRNVIQEAVSGNEQRFSQWTKCRSTGNLMLGL